MGEGGGEEIKKWPESPKVIFGRPLMTFLTVLKRKETADENTSLNLFFLLRFICELVVVYSFIVCFLILQYSNIS